VVPPTGAYDRRTGALFAVARLFGVRYPLLDSPHGAANSHDVRIKPSVPIGVLDGPAVVSPTGNSVTSLTGASPECARLALDVLGASSRDGNATLL
jgi:hypothetical protein